MFKSKQKQESTQANTYQYIAPPTTPAQEDLNKTVDTAYDTPDPSIPYVFANAHEQANNYYNDLYGANVSPELRGKMLESTNQNLDQQHGQALREDAYNRKQAKVGAKITTTGMQAPQLVQTGGTFKGTSETSQPWGPAVIGAVAGMGEAAITGGMS